MKNFELQGEGILPLSTPAKRFRFERYVKTLSQRIMTIHRLLIAIEHALPNWLLVEEALRKGVLGFSYRFSLRIISRR